MGSAVLTSSNASWAWSNTGGATTITIEAIGGGGGGGGENGYPAGGGGGKGGSYAKVTITKGAESTLDITVGAAGSAGSGADGGSGAASIVIQNGTTVLRAGGGEGGKGSTANNHFGAGGSVITDGATGSGGTPSSTTNVGDVTWAGGNGSAGVSTPTSGAGGGAGGPDQAGGAGSGITAGTASDTAFLDNTIYGGDGGAGRNAVGAGNAGQSSYYGGAGGGGLATASTNRAGGAGRPGVVVITWTDAPADLSINNVFDATNVSEDVNVSIDDLSVNVYDEQGSTDVLSFTGDLGDVNVVDLTRAEEITPPAVQVETGTEPDLAIDIFDATGTIDAITVGELEQVRLVLSDNIAASAATDTTAQLTAPSGKTTGDFQAGKISDDTNPITTDLQSGKYTELEFSIKFATNLDIGDEIEFRISNAGAVIDAYSVTPKVTISVSAADLSINVVDSIHAEDVVNFTGDLGGVNIFDNTGSTDVLSFTGDLGSINVFDAQGAVDVIVSAAMDDLGINVVDSVHVEDVPSFTGSLGDVLVIDSQGVLEVISAALDDLLINVNDSARATEWYSAGLDDLTVNVFDATRAEEIAPTLIFDLAIDVHEDQGTTDVPSFTGSLGDINVVDSTRAEEITPLTVQVEVQGEYYINVYDNTGSIDIPTIALDDLLINVHEDQGTAESITAALDDLLINVNDSTRAEEVTPPTVQVEAAGDLAVNVFDNIGSSDVQVFNLSLADINVVDSTGSVDVIALDIPIEVNVFEQQGTSESIGLALDDLLINVNDSTRAIEAITAALDDLIIDVHEDQGTTEFIDGNASLADIVVFDATGKPDDVVNTSGDLGDINVYDSKGTAEYIGTPVLQIEVNVFEQQGTLDVFTGYVTEYFLFIYDEIDVIEDLTIICNQVGSYSVSVSDPIGTDDVPTVRLDDLEVNVHEDQGTTDVVITSGPDCFADSVIDEISASDVPFVALDDLLISVVDSTSALDIIAVEETIDVVVFEEQGVLDYVPQPTPSDLFIEVADDISIIDIGLVSVFDEFIAIDVYDSVHVEESGGTYFQGQAVQRFIFKSRHFSYIIESRVWRRSIEDRVWRRRLKRKL